MIKIAGRSKVLLWHLYRAVFNRERLSVVGVRRTEGRVSATASQSLDVAQSPHKVKEVSGCIRATRSRFFLLPLKFSKQITEPNYEKASEQAGCLRP